MFCVSFVIISKIKCNDILFIFMFSNVKQKTKKHTTKTYAYILILYFETYGFKYVERMASKGIAARSDGS